MTLPPKTQLSRYEIRSLIGTGGMGEVYVAVEGPKGELGYYIVSDGSPLPYRFRIRSADFVNLSILPKILPGHMISDVVTILGSFDFVMGECDR